MQNSKHKRQSPRQKTMLALAVAATLSNGMALAASDGATWSSGNYSVGASDIVSSTSASSAVTASGSLGTLSNSGRISGYGNYSGIENYGVISKLINNAGGTISHNGTFNSSNARGILNSGVIGVLNNAGGTIQSSVLAIENFQGRIGTLSNSGLISATNQGIANYAGSIGTLINSGVINSGYAGVYNTVFSNLDTLINSGVISAPNGSAITNSGSRIGTLSNGGVISGYRGIFTGGSSGVISILNNEVDGSIIANQADGVAIFNIGGSIGVINNSGLISGPTGIQNTINSTLGAVNNSGTIAGNIVNESVNDLIINGGFGSRFGVLTGYDGGLTQASRGFISNSYSNVQFNYGNLLLNDALYVGGHTVANNGARLQLNNRIYVDGNYTQAAGAGLIFGVSDAAIATGNLGQDSGYGLLLVGGSVTLASGSSVGLSKTGSAYTFAQGQRYLVLTAVDGANSNFNENSLNYTLNATGLSLSGENVAATQYPAGWRSLVLTVVGGDGSSNSISGATMRNSRASLDGLFEYRGTDAQLMNLARAGSALGAAGNNGGAQLSPAATASAASTASVTSTGKVFDVVAAHMDSLRTAQMGNGSSGIATGESSNGKGLWGQAFGGNSRQEARDDVSGYHASYHGMLLGADAELNDSWSAGGLFSYTKTSVNNDGDNRHNSADIDSYGLIGYATYSANPWYVNLSAGAVQHQYDTKRQVNLTGFDGAANGNYDGMQYLAAVQAGYPIDLGTKTTLTPIAGLTYSTLEQDSYTEKGGNGAALRVKSDDIYSLKSDLGAKLERSFATSYGELIPAAKLTWRHEFRDEGLHSVANYTADASGETGFSSSGPSAIDDTGVLSLGATLVRSSQLSLSAKYTLEAGSGYTANTGNLQARWDF